MCVANVVAYMRIFTFAVIWKLPMPGGAPGSSTRSAALIVVQKVAVCYAAAQLPRERDGLGAQCERLTGRVHDLPVADLAHRVFWVGACPLGEVAHLFEARLLRPRPGGADQLLSLLPVADGYCGVPQSATDPFGAAGRM